MFLGQSVVHYGWFCFHTLSVHYKWHWWLLSSPHVNKWCWKEKHDLALNSWLSCSWLNTDSQQKKDAGVFMAGELKHFHGSIDHFYSFGTITKRIFSFLDIWVIQRIGENTFNIFRGALKAQEWAGQNEIHSQRTFVWASSTLLSRIPETILSALFWSKC